MSDTAADDTDPSTADRPDEDQTSLAYKAVLGVLTLVGIVAVVVGFGGTFIILTGGTGNDAASAEVAALSDEGLECDSFEGDPGVAHEGSYVRFDRTGALVEDVTAIPTDDSVLVEMSGQVINASAVRGDGTELNVSVGDNSAVVQNGTTESFYRLWIDSVDADAQFQEGAIVRSELNVCP